MKAPKCRLCGEVHWGSCKFPGVTTNVTNVVDYVVDDTEKPKSVDSVTKRDLPPVTPRDNVTGSDARTELNRERLQLLDRLAEINREIGPMTAAERQRISRARRRANARP